MIFKKWKDYVFCANAYINMCGCGCGCMYVHTYIHIYCFLQTVAGKLQGNFFRGFKRWGYHLSARRFRRKGNKNSCYMVLFLEEGFCVPCVGFNFSLIP